MRAICKTTVLIVVLLFGAMGMAGTAAAADGGQVLITSAGQSPGAMMVQVLATRAGLDNEYDPTASAEALAEADSLIIVIGASMKGLGAAGIDLQDEFDRINALLERAAEMNIPIIAMHVEGAPRRGGTSDDLSHTVFSYATHGVVRADGDDDGFFATLASENRIELNKVNATADVAGVLEELYN